MIAAIDAKAAELTGAGAAGRRGAGRSGDDLTRLNGQLSGLYAIVEGADAAPTTQAEAAWKDLAGLARRRRARWQAVRPTTSRS